MSLVDQVQSLATQLGTDYKATKSDYNGKIGVLANLSTTAKGDLVSAVNEVKASTAQSGAQINDSTTAVDTVWSSSQTNTAINNSKNSILGGATAAYDTLLELKNLIDSGDATDQADIATLTTAMGNRVRFDAAQVLDATQMAQAIANIGAISSADVGDVNVDLVSVYNTAKA